MTNNENQTLVDAQIKDAPIETTVGNGNGSSESTPQIKFGSGLPLVNSLVPSAVSVGLMPEKTYKSKGASFPKFALAKFLEFEMVDSKPIMEQVEAMQLLTHEIESEGMFISEMFMVNNLIEKLPPSWEDFKIYLKHMRNAISLVNLIVRLRIESRNRIEYGVQICEHDANVGLVKNNPMEWWYDMGSTTHICIDKDMFKTYQICESEERLFMCNTDSSKIEGRGTVVLRMTSGSEITLQNVKHMPDMRKNLISGMLISKAGFAITFEFDKLVLKKNGMYMGEGC